MKHHPSPKTFARWLENHADKVTPVGIMARGWIEDRETTTAAQSGDHSGAGCADYILGGWFGSDGPEGVATLAQALASYSSYLKRWATRRAAYVARVDAP